MQEDMRTNTDKTAEKVLTVSIAAYNVADYLQKALESCIVQNAEKLEVIVVNDGSADGTLEVARGFEHRMPGTFRVIDKPNGGYGSTVNASLSVATGRYFRLLDGDDWFDTDSLEHLIDSLGSCEEDAVFTPYTKVFENGDEPELVDELPQMPEGSHGMGSFAPQGVMAACALTFKTSVLRTMGFRMTEHCFYTDTEYAVLPFRSISSIRILKSPLYCYRIGREGQSMSVSGMERHYKDVIRTCSRLLEEIGDDAFSISPYLGNTLSLHCVGPYFFLTSIPATKERKSELREYDRLARRSPRAYREMVERSKRLRLLKDTHFLAYGILCRRAVGGDR